MKMYIIFSIMGCIWQGVRGLTPAQAANPPQGDKQNCFRGRMYELIAPDMCDICSWILSYISLSFKNTGFHVCPHAVQTLTPC